MFKHIFDAASEAAHANQAMVTAAVLIFAAFAIAHLTAILYPPGDGQAHKVTRIVTICCLTAIVLLAIWFVRSAGDAWALFKGN